jgi:hypothetical protein
MDLQEVGGRCGDWMELAQDSDRWRALVSMVRNLGVRKMRGISWLAAEPVSFSRRTLLHGVSKYMNNHSIMNILRTSTHICKHTQENNPRDSFYIVGQQGIYCIFMTHCKISLFHKIPFISIFYLLLFK